MTDIVVREALPAEYDTIGRLTLEAYRADGQLQTETGYEEVLVDVAARAAAGEVLVATGVAGEVLGSVLFVRPGSRYAELSRPGEVEFRMLAVDPSAQRRGVGQALVESCVARALALGSRAVVICVRDFSVSAQRLYARLGFRRVPELDLQPVAGVRLLGLRLELTADTSPADHRDGSAH